MSDSFLDKVQDRFVASAADTDGGGLTATKAAVTGATHAVSHISASGDAAALVTIESPASTVIWRKRFAAAFTMSDNFEPGQVMGAEGQAVLVKVSASTTNSEANIAGYTI